MASVITNVSANNQVELAKELILSASMSRKDRVYKTQLESVVDSDNKPIWDFVVEYADQWGVEIHD